LLGLLLYSAYQGLKGHEFMALGLLVGCTGLFFDEHSVITKPDDIWLIVWLPLIMTYWGINHAQIKCVAEFQRT